MSKIKTSLLALGLLLVFAGTVSTISPLFSKVAKAALTDAQRQECYNTYNGKRVSELPIGKVTGDLYKTCVLNSDASCTRPANPGDTIKCQDPAAENRANTEATKAKADAAEKAPIIKVVCGTVPTGRGGVEIYNNCARQTKIIYDDCSYPEGGPLQNDQLSDSITASCAMNRLKAIPGAKSFTQQQVLAAITTGRADAKKIYDDAAKAKSKKDCEAAKGTWENDKCTPAAEEVGPVCSGGMLGWVLCPLADLAVNVTNFFAEWTAKFLTFTPLLASDQGKAIQAVWQLLVNLANILLVIAFLFVVFSQATSVGLTSYGIKKMLPKIVAAAILMNLSFFLCAAAVDISNILGQSVAGIIQVGMNALPDPGTGIASELRKASDSPISGGAFAAAAGVLIGLPLVATGQIFAVLPILVTAATVMLTAFLIILFRQVAIVILIIIAPLAFVAWVLPNTESWFTKWRKLFVSLLLMFPLIMGIFYGATFLSNIMLLTLDPTKTGIEQETVQVGAIAILFAPLSALPFVMNAVGGILDRFGIAANNRQKGLIDRTRNKSNEWKGRTAYQRGKELRKRAADEFRQTKFASKLARGGFTGVRARGVAGNVGRLPFLENTNLGAQNSRLTSYAIQAEREAAGKRRKAIQDEMTSQGYGIKQTSERYHNAIKEGRVDDANAALGHFLTFGGSGRTAMAQVLQDTDLNDIKDAETRQKMGTELNTTVGRELYSSIIGSRADIAKGGFRDGSNKFEFTDISKLTAPQIATQDRDVHVRGKKRGEYYNADEAYIAMTNPELISKISDSDTRQELSSLSGVPIRSGGNTSGPQNPPNPGGGNNPRPRGGGGGGGGAGGNPGQGPSSPSGGSPAPGTPPGGGGSPAAPPNPGPQGYGIPTGPIPPSAPLGPMNINVRPPSGGPGNAGGRPGQTT